MQFLAFQLYAPLSSYGEPAVGEARPTHNYPGRSMVLGLLAAALGIKRDDEQAHTALRDHYGLAVAVYGEGSLLRDYHTAQVPSASDLKKRPHATRSDELAIANSRLNTVLSTRDYRQDACHIVLLWGTGDSAPYPLDTLRSALLAPTFTLYIGRKSCPPAWPMQPQLTDADTLASALAATHFVLPDTLSVGLKPHKFVWQEGVNLGMDEGTTQYTVPRKDEPLSRARWQFADRTEQVALLNPATADKGAHR